MGKRRRVKKVTYEGIEKPKKTVKELTENAEEFVEEILKGKEEPDDSAETLEKVLKKGIEEGKWREERDKKKKE